MNNTLVRVSEFASTSHPDPVFLGGKGASLVRMAARLKTAVLDRGCDS